MAKKPVKKCHIEQSFGVLSRAVHDLTKRLESVEIQQAEEAQRVILLRREVDRIKSLPWWLRWFA